MKVEINIDPERIDYDEINKTIINRLENIPQDELLKEIFKASDTLYYRDDALSATVDKVVIDWVVKKVVSSFDKQYCDEYGKLTTNGKTIIENSVKEGFRDKVFSILDPILEDPEFKNIIIDFIRHNSGAILYKLITEDYTNTFARIESADMEKRAELESRLNNLCSRLNGY